MNIIEVTAIICLVVELCEVQGAKIVGIFGSLSFSHIMKGRDLLKELARRGHDVTLITHFPPTENQKNYNEIQISLDQKIRDNFRGIVVKESPSFNGQIYGLTKVFYQLNIGILSNQNFQNYINTTSTIDLFITQPAFHEVFFGLAYKYNAPLVTLSNYGSCSFYAHTFGNPLPYAVVPDLFTSYSDHMSFMERIWNTLQATFISSMMSTVNIWYQEMLIQQYFPNTPPLQKLIENITINLLYSHFSTETTRPAMPGNINVGGFHLYKKKVAIPKDIKNFVDDANDGVILMSLGSHLNDKDIRKSVSESIIKVLNNQIMKVLLKYDKVPKNIGNHVMIKSWFPQLEIWTHPNIKLFITHGGLNSLMEASSIGIPIVGIPFFVDQEQNVLQAVRKGFGVKVALNNFTTLTFSNAIKQVLENPSFKTNALRQKDIFLDREVNPMDSAIYWVEYAMRHKGAPHLKNRLKSIAWYQYLLLDVLVFLGFATILTVIAFYIIFIRFIRLLRYSKNLQITKNKVL